MAPVEMPKANENLTEATLDRWLVQEGALVSEGQALCDIITDKAKFEMPSPGPGTVLKRFAPERSVLPVGYVLCLLGSPGDAIPDDIEKRNEALLAAHKGLVAHVGAGTPSVIDAASGGVSNAVRATPAARRVAKELGVDLASVAQAYKLTGPVNEKDVRAFAAK